MAQKIFEIENGRGYPTAEKEGSYYWVQRHYDPNWEICLWDGFVFLAYGRESFEIRVPLPKKYQEIKKPK